MTQRRILVLSGRGRYEDPWHDHAATSHVVAGILGDQGDVEVRGLFRDALDDLDSVDLLVVNGGSGRRDAGFDGSDDDWLAAHDRLSAWARAGGAVLGLHQAANTFYDAPDWAAVLGGRWIPGESMHPPIGTARFELVQGHPVTDDLRVVEAFDERYCHLKVAPGTRVLGTTLDDDGTPHPVLWVNEAHGGRSVYSALGHDVRSFESEGHQELLRRSAAWLLS
ncbi:ThuA domain-containing protein [Promicromonospora kroppenstedtii]|uniref:ThuA domain-containing protein n=1 Tax=Promicromonospora kroppenstedtii TaxID=440482 RepID=UPI0004B0AFD6|nr:ThuA domain-containing protein [Promicromonospora kroppenstedtii]